MQLISFQCCGLMFTLVYLWYAKYEETLGLQEFTLSWCCWCEQIISSLFRTLLGYLVIPYLEGSLDQQFLEAEGYAKFQGIDFEFTLY